MTITVAATPTAAATTSPLPNGPAAQETLAEGLPGEFASVFSQLVDRFNAFASEGKPAVEGRPQGLLNKAPQPMSTDSRVALIGKEGKPSLPLDQGHQDPASDMISGAQSLQGANLQTLGQALATQEKTREEAAIREEATPASLDALAALANFMLPAASVSPAIKGGETISGQSTAPGLTSALPAGPGNGAPALNAAPLRAASETAASSDKLAAPGGKPGQDFSAIIAGAQQSSGAIPSETSIPANSPSAVSMPTTPPSPGGAPHLHTGTEVRREISLPVGTNGWSNGLGDQVAWMSRNNQQQAQITLNPPNLGPLQITISLNSDQLNAQFVSPHAEVRQAIQEAMPQLKEMLASSGIALGQSSVGSEPSRQQHDPSASQRDPSRYQADQAILEGDHGQVHAAPAPVIRGGRGMVDLFA